MARRLGGCTADMLDSVRRAFKVRASNSMQAVMILAEAKARFRAREEGKHCDQGLNPEVCASGGVTPTASGSPPAMCATRSRCCDSVQRAAGSGGRIGVCDLVSGQDDDTH